MKLWIKDRSPQRNSELASVSLSPDIKLNCRSEVRCPHNAIIIINTVSCGTGYSFRIFHSFSRIKTNTLFYLHTTYEDQACNRNRFSSISFPNFLVFSFGWKLKKFFVIVCRLHALLLPINVEKIWTLI